MEALFYGYTIAIIVVCIAASTAALSSYLVTKSKLSLCFAIAFLCYILDLSLIFQNEYLSSVPIGTSEFYYIRHPFIKAFIALAVLESAWVALLEYLNKKSLALILAPAGCFALAITLVTLFMPEGPWRQWCFYSTREAFLIWMLVYVAFQRAHASSTVLKSRLARIRPLFVISAVMCACIIAENTFMILAWTPPTEGPLRATLLLYFAERNISENVFVVLLAVLSLRDSFRTMRLRRKDWPNGGEDTVRLVEITMDVVCEKYNLTPREREVLSCIVAGRDYQNTASELDLALGTVKSHMHNIFQKTHTKTTPELLECFWSN